MKSKKSCVEKLNKPCVENFGNKVAACAAFNLTETQALAAAAQITPSALHPAKLGTPHTARAHVCGCAYPSLRGGVCSGLEEVTIC